MAAKRLCSKVPGTEFMPEVEAAGRAAGVQGLHKDRL